MKVKVISRNPSNYFRETKHDINKIQRNYDPKLHPFEIPREYQRALNAVKIDKIFAKPFIGALDGHSDVVECMMKHPTSLTHLVSGATDGEIKFWNVARQTCLRTINAHHGIVRSLCSSQDGDYFFSVGDNSTIKQWRFVRSWEGKLATRLKTKQSTSKEANDDEDDKDEISDDEEEEDDDDDDDEIIVPEGLNDRDNYEVPISTIIGKTFIYDIDHHWRKPIFVTSGENVEIWEENRSEPLQTLSWGVDSVNKIKFNPVETDICVSSASDRSIILYDIRQYKPIRKIILQMRSNSLSWNPMEAFHFTAANEDHNLYSFDMRKMDRPQLIHKDHCSAVIDVDYSPTGKEFVSGSYDKTVRIFTVDKSRSREVYHTKRMQKLTTVAWTLDNKFILSGSDEMDIRIWKANASEKLSTSLFREQAALKYRDKLKEKFGHHPEIKKIATHRHVPKRILHERRQKHSMQEAKMKRQANRRIHSKRGRFAEISEKKSVVVRTDS